jgi:hypothetical protein
MQERLVEMKREAALPDYARQRIHAAHHFMMDAEEELAGIISPFLIVKYRRGRPGCKIVKCFDSKAAAKQWVLEHCKDNNDYYYRLEENE